MDSNYSNNQFFGSDNTINNLASHEKAVIDSRTNIPYITLQNYSSNQCYGNHEVSMTQQILQPSVNTTINSSIVQDNFIIEHPIMFFYRPPNDLYIYQIRCKEIKEISIQLLNEFSSNVSNNFNQNEYVFFYQQQTGSRIYQVVCEIVSPSFVINLLNKTVHGVETKQNIEFEELSFKFDQKENLKYYLTQHLNCFLLD
jgi:hypothetical protein